MEKRQTWKEILVDFAQSTNVHGLGRVVRNDKNLARKVAWLLMTLAGLVVLSAWATNLAQNYWRYEVDVNVQVVHKRNLIFPALTLCNPNPVRGSMLKKYAPESPDLQKLIDIKIEAKNVKNFKKAMKKKSNISNIDNDQNTKTLVSSPKQISVLKEKRDLSKDNFGPFISHRKFLEKLALVNTSLKKVMGHQRKQMIFTCSFNGKSCIKEKAFERFWNYKYGNCFTFNSGWNNQSELVKASLPGALNGLKLILLVEEHEYINELIVNTGIVAQIHLQNRIPFPEDEGIEIAPGYQTSIGVRLREIIRKPAPFPSKCRQRDSLEYNLNGLAVEYSPQACIKTCLQNETVQKCGCSNVQFPLIAKSRVCGSTVQNDSDCMRLIDDSFHNDLIECDCPEACKDILFTTRKSFSRWPNREFAHRLVKTLQQIKLYKPILNRNATKDENIYKLQEMALSLNVYYDDFNYEKIEEVQRYSLSSLVSDVGGQMGLWLGLSVIALFEFVELFFTLMCHFIDLDHDNIDGIKGKPNGKIIYYAATKNDSVVSPVVVW